MVGGTDTPMKIAISDRDIGGNDSQGRWSLLTFTNPSLTKGARWETQIIRQGGTAYQNLRQAIMNTRSQIGLCPGNPLQTPCEGIFPAVTKIVHLALRKNALGGTTLPETERAKMVEIITSVIQDHSLFEGEGSPNNPYRMCINMKWGRYKVQGMRKLWMWEAIAAALSSINDTDYMVIQLMVDATDLEAVENSVRQSREDDDDLDVDPGQISSSRQTSQRERASSEIRPQGPNNEAPTHLLSSNHGRRQPESAKQGRSSTRRTVSVRFDSTESHSPPSTPRGILRQSSTQTQAEGSEEISERSGSEDEDEEDKAPSRASSRASSTQT